MNRFFYVVRILTTILEGQDKDIHPEGQIYLIQADKTMQKLP